MLEPINRQKQGVLAWIHLTKQDETTYEDQITRHIKTPIKECMHEGDDMPHPMNEGKAKGFTLELKIPSLALTDQS